MEKEDRERQEFIDRFLIIFARYWKVHPYMRFGQIVEGTTQTCCSFYFKDEEFMQRLEERLSND